ncbi:MAG TPA: sulfotransferase [Solirubrobacteraceae bacterium]|nr:sulfotransferase [Solirubrobacteraceae bacterium]
MPGHLIHVGFPKAGSTALGAWFDAHPQVAYAPNGLGGFYHAFDLAAAAAGAGEPPPWHVTSAESLSFPRITDDPVARARGAPARAVTLTESRERVCRMLRALYPGATILIVTRGFRGAMLSGYSQYVKTGGRGAASELRPEPDVIAEALDYDAVVALYEAAFGPERVIVLPFELLRDDAAAFARVLEERLGLEPAAAPIAVRNPGLSPAALAWQRRLSHAVGLAARALPGRLGDRLMRAYVRLGTGERLRRPLELLARAVPGSRAAAVDVPDDVLAPLRGRASSLAGRPFYERYAAEYLNG